MRGVTNRSGGWTGLAWSLGVTVGLACAAPVQAQSSYALSTLKPATTAVPLSVSPLSTWAIDANDHVLGTAEHFMGYAWVFTALAYRPVYTPFVTRWPASTSASVSPSKWVSAANQLSAASPNGQQLMLVNDETLYDVASKKVVGALPTLAPRALSVAVNNSGQVLARIEASRTVSLAPASTGEFSWLITHAATWRAATGLTRLPEGAAASSQGYAINASGTVAGAVTDDATRVQQAALWVNGALQRMAQVPQTASAAIQINDKGQVLVRREPVASCPTGPTVLLNCHVNAGTVYLHDNGVESALLPADARRWIASARLNNQGVVVGRYQTGTVLPTQQLGPTRDETYTVPGASADAGGDGRAFIWQRGVFSDLTDWVKARGVSLPAGAVLTHAVALNDKGSIVAQMRLSTGAAQMVRLTARP